METSAIKGSDIARGMKVRVVYRNAGFIKEETVEILGVTDTSQKYGESGVRYGSVREALRAEGVSSLRAAQAKQDAGEYGHGLYLVAREIPGGDEGAWYYLSSGRWSRGSGADRIQFFPV
jgi:hypothetical protein